MNLQELFNQCLENNNGDKIKAAQQFIVKAKKENPSVKMNDCMAAAGYTKETEQNFRNSVLIPVRNRIGLIRFNLQENDMKKIFGRVKEANLTEDEVNKKKAILSSLPVRSRTTKPKEMNHIDELING
jgi:hypothetical protein